MEGRDMEGRKATGRSVTGLGLLLIALAGCAGGEEAPDSYEPPALTTVQSAILERAEEARIWDLDRKAWPAGGQQVRVKIGPGRHTINDMVIEAESGQSYVVHAASGDGVYRSWIENAESGRVLGTSSLFGEAWSGGAPAAAQVGSRFPKFALADGRRFRVIGVRAAAFDGVASWNEPLSGAGGAAASGAGKGAWAGLTMPCAGSWGCMVVVPIVTVVGAAGGAVAGAAKSHDAEEVAAATATLKRQFAKSDPARELRAAVVAELGRVRDGHYDVRDLSGAGAALPDAARAGEGLDAILDLRIVKLALTVPAGVIEPRAQLLLLVRASLTAVPRAGGAEPAAAVAQAWRFTSSGRDYFELAAAEGQPLRDDLSTAYRRSGAQIVADLFTGDAPPRESASRRRSAASAGPPRLSGEETDRLVARIESYLRSSGLAYLRREGAVPDTWRNISLIRWDVTALTADRFTLELHYRYRPQGSGSSESRRFVLEGTISDEAIAYSSISRS